MIRGNPGQARKVFIKTVYKYTSPWMHSGKSPRAMKYVAESQTSHNAAGIPFETYALKLVEPQHDKFIPYAMRMERNPRGSSVLRFTKDRKRFRTIDSVDLPLVSRKRELSVKKAMWRTQTRHPLAIAPEYDEKTRRRIHTPATKAVDKEVERLIKFAHENGEAIYMNTGRKGTHDDYMASYHRRRNRIIAEGPNVSADDPKYYRRKKVTPRKHR